MPTDRLPVLHGTKDHVAHRGIRWLLAFSTHVKRTMLETAPRRWNRVVEGRTPALMQSNQREILGIVFHTLCNWHSGFSGMVVWIAWLVLLGHNPCGQLLRTAQRRGERCCYWLSEEERALLCKCMHFNEHTLSHKFKKLRQLAGSPTGHGASSQVSLHFSPDIRTLAAAVAGLVSLHCDAPCAKEDLDLVVCCF